MPASPRLGWLLAAHGPVMFDSTNLMMGYARLQGAAYSDGTRLRFCRADEEAEFKEFATQPEMLEVVSKYIAPSIFGHDNIKKAVACLLFGGARKVCR